MTDYDHIKPRTVATLKFRKVEENMKTHTITIPDGYTAAEIEQHLASLPKRKPEPGAVAINAYQKAIERGSGGGCVWSAVEQACREGYVERDKIEAALATPVCLSLYETEFNDGFRNAWDKLSRLIQEELK